MLWNEIRVIVRKGSIKLKVSEFQKRVLVVKSSIVYCILDIAGSAAQLTRLPLTRVKL